MTLHLFRRTNSTPTPARRPRTTRHSFALESLEDRLVMSHASIVPAAMPAVHVAPSVHNTVSVPIRITGVNLTGVTTGLNNAITGVTGTVTGTIAGRAFSTPLTITHSTTSSGVPVLNLHLAPIDLNLLGLEVKTSDICLNITAVPGPGNLLGNLVGGLANALNATAPAANTAPAGLLGSLTTQLNTVTTGAKGTGSSSVVGLLNSALSSALGSMKPSSPAATSPSAATPAVDNLVHLSVGPLNLNLLGLVVNLDNCNKGPVTVDVNAIKGPGNLLGNLLDGVAHLLDSPGHGGGLLSRLDNQIIALIQGL